MCFSYEKSINTLKKTLITEQPDTVCLGQNPAYQCPWTPVYPESDETSINNHQRVSCSTTTTATTITECVKEGVLGENSLKLPQDSGVAYKYIYSTTTSSLGSPTSRQVRERDTALSQREREPVLTPTLQQTREAILNIAQGISSWEPGKINRIAQKSKSMHEKQMSTTEDTSLWVGSQEVTVIKRMHSICKHVCP